MLPRVRFAPSPTGPLHIGGVRTALYNYLFARKHNGIFILRIEDTDQARLVPGAEKYIIDSLQWCGISFDEGPGMPGGGYGPYRQSDRKTIYRQYAEDLVKKGYAYYAFDSAAELEAMRQRLKEVKASGQQYDSSSRMAMKNSLTLAPDEVKSRMDSGEPYVIRIKISAGETVSFRDIIHGTITVHTSDIDDKVLFKSDGMPTYHLANVTDDYLMKISHVIRGDEWLPSTPLHVLLYRYLGWESSMPQFTHLPLILRPDGNGKLSKRDGDRMGFPVFPLTWKDPASGEISTGYRERGYFPEAVVNFLAFLGWNPGTEQELFSPDELINAFSLEKVQKAGARFDHEKIKWFNQQYLRKKTDEQIASLVQPALAAEGVKPDFFSIVNLCRILKERAFFINDMVSEGKNLFSFPGVSDLKPVEKKLKPGTGQNIRELLDKFSLLTDYSLSGIDKTIHSFIGDKKLSPGEIMPLLRYLLTGKTSGPAVFEIMGLLGKEETVKRMEAGIILIQKFN